MHSRYVVFSPPGGAMTGMAVYLYLSLIPEALIYSMLPPQEFGKYLASGNSKTTESPAVFFEVDPSFRSEAFNLEGALEECHVHEDGSPRRSTYVSVYHVLANMPVSALGTLHLATRAGFTLELEAAPYGGDPEDRFYLYQEVCPVQPRVASRLGPQSFCQFVTDPEERIFLPRIVYAELQLGELATNPESAVPGDLPYSGTQHLRACLLELRARPQKMTKIVNRDLQPELFFSMVTSGYYVGDQDAFRFYPMPSEDDLARDHFLWWNSARKARRY